MYSSTNTKPPHWVNGCFFSRFFVSPRKILQSRRPKNLNLEIQKIGPPPKKNKNNTHLLNQTPPRRPFSLSYKSSDQQKTVCPHQTKRNTTTPCAWFKPLLQLWPVMWWCNWMNICVWHKTHLNWLPCSSVGRWLGRMSFNDVMWPAGWVENPGGWVTIYLSNKLPGHLTENIWYLPIYWSIGLVLQCTCYKSGQTIEFINS